MRSGFRRGSRTRRRSAVSADTCRASSSRTETTTAAR